MLSALTPRSAYKILNERVYMAGVAAAIIAVVEDAPSAFAEDISDGRKNREMQGVEYIQRILSNPICQNSNSLMGAC